MFKKMMMCAVMMSASIPVCAGNLTITSLGDAYKVSVERQYVRLNNQGRAVLDADGHCIWVKAKTKFQLQPNMSMEIKEEYQDRLYITIERNGTPILDNVRHWGMNRIALDKDTCSINGHQVDIAGKQIQD